MTPSTADSKGYTTPWLKLHLAPDERDPELPAFVPTGYARQYLLEHITPLLAPVVQAWLDELASEASREWQGPATPDDLGTDGESEGGRP